MRKRVVKSELSCDYCRSIHGNAKIEDSGRMGEPCSARTIQVKHLKCNHDICDSCYYYPGDLNHCPKCGPNRVGAIGNAKKKTKRDWCFKHKVVRQSDGSCISCKK